MPLDITPHHRTNETGHSLFPIDAWDTLTNCINKLDSFLS